MTSLVGLTNLSSEQNQVSGYDDQLRNQCNPELPIAQGGVFDRVLGVVQSQIWKHIAGSNSIGCGRSCNDYSGRSNDLRQTQSRGNVYSTKSL